ncbi:MAG: hypothetical protein M0R66_05545, partial [Candidatus Omnitrophica bacterium]|nr:hypothetical protein [Candidatus Omnitrophota bacterium]
MDRAISIWGEDERGIPINDSPLMEFSRRTKRTPVRTSERKGGREGVSVGVDVEILIVAAPIGTRHPPRVEFVDSGRIGTEEVTVVIGRSFEGDREGEFRTVHRPAPEGP